MKTRAVMSTQLTLLLSIIYLGTQSQVFPIGLHMVVGYTLSFQSVLQCGQYRDIILRRKTPKRSKRDSIMHGVRCSKIYGSIHRKVDNVRVFVVSDLHTDYEENMTWVNCISTKTHKDDVLIVAGDVAETRDKLFSTMVLLRNRFNHVLYVPGNHDLWCRKDDEYYHDSLDKLNRLLDACDELNVMSSPMIIGDVGIIPLFSWYHESFDKEQDINELRIPSLEMACKDFRACKWSAEFGNRDDSLAQHFDAMNDKYAEVVEEITRTCKNVITFSHFVPRQDLCPEKRMLFYPNLPKIIGSDFLEARIRSIHGSEGNSGACHVFGHTHFGWDTTLDGIRYVQAPLGYPRERKRRMNGGEDWLPFCLYSNGIFAETRQFYWSQYYLHNPREPDNLQLAPWVSKFYRRPAS